MLPFRDTEKLLSEYSTATLKWSPKLIELPGGAIAACNAPPSQIWNCGFPSTVFHRRDNLEDVAPVSISKIRSFANALSNVPLKTTVTVAPDGDEAGRAACLDLAERATALGWRVDTLDPGDGLDWNDVIQKEAIT